MSAKDQEELSVMASPRVVCRECLSQRGVDALLHVVRGVNACLDSFSGRGAVEAACERGSSEEMLDYLASRDTESFWTNAAKLAARNGHVHVLQWLSDRHPDRCQWGVEVMNEAAEGGHLAAVQWLHANRSHGGGITPAMKWAERSGNQALVQWMRDNQSEGHAGRALRAAASNGHLEIVKWLHAARGECPGGDVYCDGGLLNASRNGHTHVVQWLQARHSMPHRTR